MPRNGSGDYTLPKPAFVPNTTISSADVNSDFSDIADALTGSIAADGQTPITGQLQFPSGSAAFPSHTFESELTTGMYLSAASVLGFSAGGVAAVLIDTTKFGVGQDGSVLRYANGAVIQPVGKVSSFAGSTAPPGWFLLYGQAVSRTAYPELFEVCSTTYGSGDGSTTFNLPDARGRVDYGKDDMGGSAAGRITNFSGVTLGATGGNQNSSLITVNLPPYTPSGSVSGSCTATGGNTTTIFGNNTGNNFNTGGGSAFVLLGNSTVASTTFNVSVSVSGSISGTMSGNAQGGTSTPFATLPPGIVFNKIIFAGRV